MFGLINPAFCLSSSNLFLIALLGIPKGVNITSIIHSACRGAVYSTLCSNPHSQTPKKPENAFHKRQSRAFSQFRPIQKEPA